MKQKECMRCLYLILTVNHEYKCIHPVTDKAKSPSELNKDKDCKWWDRNPTSMV